MNLRVITGVLERAAAIFILVAFLSSALGMIYSVVGTGEEGGKLIAMDRVVLGLVPMAIIVGLVGAFWVPWLAVVALAFCPLLIIRTPATYGSPSIRSLVLFIVPCLLQIARWVLDAQHRRRPSESV